LLASSCFPLRFDVDDVAVDVRFEHVDVPVVRGEPFVRQRVTVLFDTHDLIAPTACELPEPITQLEMFVAAVRLMSGGDVDIGGRGVPVGRTSMPWMSFGVNTG